jgi:hypothetical protein
MSNQQFDRDAAIRVREESGAAWSRMLAPKPPEQDPEQPQRITAGQLDALDQSQYQELRSSLGVPDHGLFGESKMPVRPSEHTYGARGRYRVAGTETGE